MTAQLDNQSDNWIALLGNQDQPTDALEDYCRQLAEALRKRGQTLGIRRLALQEKGWGRALRDLQRSLPELGRDHPWVLLQFTPLAWSRRGFPLGFLRLVRRLKNSGARVCIVYHDPLPFGGTRAVDRLRRAVQLRVLRKSSELADKIVLTIAPDCVDWLQPKFRDKVVFVPVGSNIPPAQRGGPAGQPAGEIRRASDVLTVSVFGFSLIERECAMIAQTVSAASGSAHPLRLIVFGRGARKAESILQPMLDGTGVALQGFDILEAQQVSEVFAQTDVQLFVRSGLSSRRSSGISGIVCGVPIVGFADAETGFPITEAGVRLVPCGDVSGLVRELTATLQDSGLRSQLRERSLAAACQYFSWDRIAESYIAALAGGDDARS